MLLAYTKETNTDVVLRSDLPDDPYVQRELVRYFPSVLGERFAEAMGGHRLRREIVATGLTNEMVNRAGTSFDYRMTEETGAGVADITRAHVVASDVLGMPRWWDRIDHLDPSIETDVQLELFLDLRRMVERGVLWLLRHRRPPLDLAATVAAFGPGIEELAGGLRAVVHGAMGATLAEAAEDALNAGVPVGPRRGQRRLADHAHRLRHRRGGAGPGSQRRSMPPPSTGACSTGSTSPGCGSGSASCPAPTAGRATPGPRSATT